VTDGTPQSFSDFELGYRTPMFALIYLPCTSALYFCSEMYLISLSLYSHVYISTLLLLLLLLFIMYILLYFVFILLAFLLSFSLVVYCIQYLPSLIWNSHALSIYLGCFQIVVFWRTLLYLPFVYSFLGFTLRPFYFILCIFSIVMLVNQYNIS
jgi:hypothetical protein